MRGYLERYQDGLIQGWVAADDIFEKALTVAVYIDDKKVAEGVNSVFRQDVVELGLSLYGQCGFSIPFNVSNNGEKRSILRVVEVETGWEVPPGRILLNLSGDTNGYLEGTVDFISPWGTSGWARFVDGTNQPIQVEVMANDTIIASGFSDIPRPDIHASGGRNNNCGFVLKFESLLPAAISVTVQAVSTGGILILFQGKPVSVEGYVETVAKWGATGWAWTPLDVNEQLTIEAHLRNRVIASTFANEYRHDLQATGRGAGRSGFTLNFDPPLSGGEAPTFFAVVNGNEKLQLAAAARVDIEIASYTQQQTRETFVKENEVTTSSLDIEGGVDLITQWHASGWVWHPNSPRQTLEVEAVLNGEVLGRAIANKMRPDLLDFGKGTGQYGFLLSFNKPLENKSAPILRVVGPEGPAVIPNQAEVHLDPRPEKPASDATFLPEAEGYVDHMTRSEAIGWVWFPSAPELCAQVEALLDGKIIGRTLADQPRPDLVQHGKGTGRYGFTIKFEEAITGAAAPEFRALPAVGHLLKNSAQLPPPSRYDFVKRSSGSFSVLLDEHSAFTMKGPMFEDFDPTILAQAAEAEGDRQRPMLVAFYLPQFHAIAENDLFWGKGFTEWRQLPKGLPRFPGHYQPRIPRDLGFYNLDNIVDFENQVAMAKTGGVNGFAYYYYWFNRKRVLEKPLEMLLNSDIDMPFMLIWANENWTRTWDGSESHVLLKQDYRAEDDDALMDDLARHIMDRRYIRLNGRPLFVIYNPKNVPDSTATIGLWRAKLRARIGVEPLIFMAQTFGEQDPRPHGLDGALEFPPHKLSNHLPGRPTPDAYSPEFAGRVIAYDDFVTASLDEDEPESYPLIKTVVPGWDNDCRRPNRGLTLEGIAPQKYQSWLTELIKRAMDTPIEGTPIVAINAWNEWAESAYLEPDVYFGAAFLNATGRAYVSAVNGRAATRTSASADFGARPRVSVILPNYNHAQFLHERIMSVLDQTIPPDEIIFLDDCSSDNSIEIASTLLAISQIPYRIIINEKNSGGVFRQWMKGLSIAKHELIWVAETDDSADRRFLSNILSAFGREDVMAAFGRITCIDREGAPRGDLDGYFDGLMDFSWSYSSVVPAFRAFSRDFTIKNVIPNASGLVFRKPVLTEEEQTRLFEYRFAGDWYFYALITRGGSIAYCRRARSFFRVNPRSASRSSFFTERHLAEHQMIIEDLRREYDISDASVAAHADSLAQYLTDQAPEALRDAFLRKAPRMAGREQMRICIAANGFTVGGGEILPVELANKLKEVGLHVTYLVIERPKDAYDNQVRKRLRNDIPVVYWDAVADDFSGFIEKYGIQLINSHNVSVDYRIFLRNLNLQVPYVVSLHGGYETVPDLLSPEFLAYLSKNVSKWLYLAERNFAFIPVELRESGKFLRSFNAVPPFAGEGICRDAFRAEHRIAAEDFVFVICSRAIEEKGWRTAIKVVEALFLRGRPVHLVLIGDGPVAGELRDEFQAYPFVTFLGPIDSPMRYFECFDMGIFPTRFEGETFPLFLLECFESGLPVATTDIGEIPRIMEGALGQKPGLLLDHLREPEMLAADLVAKLEEMFETTDAYDTYRVTARATSERFSIEILRNLYKTEFHNAIFGIVPTEESTIR